MKTFEEHVKLSGKAQKKSGEFLNKIMQTTSDNPVLSYKIEKTLSLKGAQVRQLVKHFRRTGHPIASTGRGYFYAHSIEELMPTLDHMKMRRDSINYTMNKMMEGKLFTEDQQSLL